MTTITVSGNKTVYEREDHKIKAGSTEDVLVLVAVHDMSAGTFTMSATGPAGFSFAFTDAKQNTNFASLYDGLYTNPQGEFASANQTFSSNQFSVRATTALDDAGTAFPTQIFVVRMTVTIDISVTPGSYNITATATHSVHGATNGTLTITVI